MKNMVLYTLSYYSPPSPQHLSPIFIRDFRPPDKSGWLKFIFLFLNQNICCGYSKEPSRWDGSFEHTKHMFKLMDNWPYESIRCQNNLFTFNYCKLQNKSVISVLSLFCYFFQWSVGFTQCLWESETPEIGHRNQKLMPASYGLKFEKDLTSFNLLHLWNIMCLKILWKWSICSFGANAPFSITFSNSWIISFNFLEFFQCCPK